MVCPVTENAVLNIVYKPLECCQTHRRTHANRHAFRWFLATEPFFKISKRFYTNNIFLNMLLPNANIVHVSQNTIVFRIWSSGKLEALLNIGSWWGSIRAGAFYRAVRFVNISAVWKSRIWTCEDWLILAWEKPSLCIRRNMCFRVRFLRFLPGVFLENLVSKTSIYPSEEKRWAATGLQMMLFGIRASPVHQRDSLQCFAKPCFEYSIVQLSVSLSMQI